MMKPTKLLIAIAVMGLCALPFAHASNLFPINDGPANYCMVVTSDDFTATTTNATQTITIDMPADSGAQLIYMVMPVAFDTANTNATGSTTLQVGDGTDDDRYLTSTELASDGTEITMKFGTGTQGVYSAVDTIDLLFQQVGAEALASNTTGEIRLYFYLPER